MDKTELSLIPIHIILQVSNHRFTDRMATSIETSANDTPKAPGFTDADMWIYNGFPGSMTILNTKNVVMSKTWPDKTIIVSGSYATGSVDTSILGGQSSFVLRFAAGDMMTVNIGAPTTEVNPR